MHYVELQKMKTLVEMNMMVVVLWRRKEKKRYTNETQNALKKDKNKDGCTKRDVQKEGAQVQTEVKWKTCNRERKS